MLVTASNKGDVVIYKINTNKIVPLLTVNVSSNIRTLKTKRNLIFTSSINNDLNIIEIEYKDKNLKNKKDNFIDLTNELKLENLKIKNKVFTNNCISSGGLHYCFTINPNEKVIYGYNLNNNINVIKYEENNTFDLCHQYHFY